MSDICILYTLFDRDRTVYSVRKEICEIFGLYAIPSHGTIYPALKKLNASGYLEMNDFLSEGGRKSCYFKITDKGKKYFSTLMLSDYSENPGVFMTDLKLRICAFDALSKDKKSGFVEKSLRLLELYEADVRKFLNDRYKNPSNPQKAMYELTLKEISLTEELLKGL